MTSAGLMSFKYTLPKLHFELPVDIKKKDGRYRPKVLQVQDVIHEVSLIKCYNDIH